MGAQHTTKFRATRLLFSEAEAAHFAELSKQAARVADGLPRAITVGRLLDEFEAEHLPRMRANTQRSYRDSLKPIRSFFVDVLRNPTLDRVHAAQVQRFLDWRKVHRTNGDRPVSNRTLQKDRAVLHRLFAIAERLEYRDGNPVARVQPPKAEGRQPVILSDDDFERLLAACEDRPMLWLYVLTLNETGARAESEVLRLRWDDVDLDAGFIQIVSGRDGHLTKSGKSRWTPMTPRLRAAMRAHFARYRFASYGGQPTPWVFHHPVTRRTYRAGARIHSLYDAFKKAAARAGLPEQLVQHDLRHRRVTTWLAEGANPVHVKEAVGHSDLRTTMGYTHLAREHLRSLVAPEGAIGQQQRA